MKIFWCNLRRNPWRISEGTVEKNHDTPGGIKRSSGGIPLQIPEGISLEILDGTCLDILDEISWRVPEGTSDGILNNPKKDLLRNCQVIQKETPGGVLENVSGDTVEAIPGVITRGIPTTYRNLTRFRTVNNTTTNFPIPTRFVQCSIFCLLRKELHSQNHFHFLYFSGFLPKFHHV